MLLLSLLLIPLFGVFTILFVLVSLTVLFGIYPRLILDGYITVFLLYYIVVQNTVVQNTVSQKIVI